MRFCWTRLPTQDAADVAQEVFISTYRTARGGGGPQDDQQWQRYLMTAARNHVIDYYRRLKREPPITVQADPTIAVDYRQATAGKPSQSVAGMSLITDEMQQAVRDCMERLDVGSRMMCWQVFAEGKSKRQIGRLLDKPEATVRSTLVEAVRQLRSCLEDKGLAPD